MCFELKLVHYTFPSNLSQQTKQNVSYLLIEFEMFLSLFYFTLLLFSTKLFQMKSERDMHVVLSEKFDLVNL